MAWPNVYGLDVRRFDHSQAQPRRATILLLHNAFHGPSHFDALARALREAGCRVVIPQLPSASPVVDSNSFNADVGAIIDCIKPEIDNTKDVIMVAHGYGSVVGATAADRLNRYSLDRPRAGRVVKMIFIAGVILERNESYADVVETDWMAFRQGVAHIRRPDDVLFQDCPPEVRAAAMTSISPQNESSLRTAVASPGWTRTPVLYIVCEQDNEISSDAQYAFFRLLQASNREAKVVAVQTSCPFLTIPKETAELIIRASV